MDTQALSKRLSRCMGLIRGYEAAASRGNGARASELASEVIYELRQALRAAETTAPQHSTDEHVKPSKVVRHSSRDKIFQNAEAAFKKNSGTAQ